MTDRRVQDRVRRLRERLEERRDIARALERGGMNVVVPEDDLPHDASPSLAEEEMIVHGDADVVFLNVDSWGTAAEFGQYADRGPWARKLRVLVRAEYHPLYGQRRSYLSDLYLNHLAVFGHVYAVGIPGDVPASTVPRLVELLARRYRAVLAARPELSK